MAMEQWPRAQPLQGATPQRWTARRTSAQASASGRDSWPNASAASAATSGLGGGEPAVAEWAVASRSGGRGLSVCEEMQDTSRKGAKAQRRSVWALGVVDPACLLGQAGTACVRIGRSAINQWHTWHRAAPCGNVGQQFVSWTRLAAVAAVGSRGGGWQPWRRLATDS